MSAHTRGPRRGSRKPRPRAAPGQTGAGARTAQAGADQTGAEPVGAAPTGVTRDGSGHVGPGRTGRAARSSRRADGKRVPAYRDFDGRPQAHWHPLPLSELLIVAGAAAFAVAMVRLSHHGFTATAPLLGAGVLALGLGTAEVSWREHRSGFRSHTLLLAFLPVLALHSAVVLGYSAVATPSRALNLGMFVVDVAVFALLARRLRALYADARARR